MGKVHWRRRKYQRGVADWVVGPLCNVQDIAKEIYQATTFRKQVTCRSCLRIGDKKEPAHGK